MKPIKQYICSVDHYKPLKLKHASEGVYQVGAKTSKEAHALVQSYIKFGSPGKCHEIPEYCFRDTHNFEGTSHQYYTRLPYKMVMKLFPVELTS